MFGASVNCKAIHHQQKPISDQINTSRVWWRNNKVFSVLYFPKVSLEDFKMRVSNRAKLKAADCPPDTRESATTEDKLTLTVQNTKRVKYASHLVAHDAIVLILTDTAMKVLCTNLSWNYKTENLIEEIYLLVCIWTSSLTLENVRIPDKSKIFSHIMQKPDSHLVWVVFFSLHRINFLYVWKHAMASMQNFAVSPKSPGWRSY